MIEQSTPTAIVILGGGGDLARRKLLPSLFELFKQHKLPEKFVIIGLARTERTDTVYQQFVTDVLLPHDDKLEAFTKHIRYVSGALDTLQSYTLLTEKIHDFETEVGSLTNVLFYLAVPPTHYEVTFELLYHSGIAVEKEGSSTFRHIMVEKPFGSDYITAQALDTKLSSLFKEKQIFRIDHYLAKEAVQNILSFRFANTLLKTPWNREHIQEVRITMHEKIDIGTRGSFYDPVGALRDVGQNHVLQVLALIAMDEPVNLKSDAVGKERALLLEKLVKPTPENIRTQVHRAQYVGYTETEGVSTNSQTETYFEFKTYIDSDTWRDVPFFVRAGKALDEENVSVEIFFHDVATGPFETKLLSTVGNTIVLSIAPQHAMHITLNVKSPGHGFAVEPQTLSYIWSQHSIQPVGAYQKVLYDCIIGDQTLFTSSKEVIASWQFITALRDAWSSVPLQTYAKGSGGPLDSFWNT